jgi:hypothetical protein
MPSKSRRIDKRIETTSHVRSAVLTHRDGLADALAARALLVQGPATPATREVFGILLDFLADALAHDADALDAAELAVVAERADDVEVRRNRDALAAALGARMVRVRSCVEDALGARALEAYGLSGETPRGPRAVASHAENVANLMRRAPFNVCAGGVTLDSEGMAAAIEAQAAALSEALRAMDEEEHELANKLGLRAQALEAWADGYQGSADTLVGLLRLGGRKELAERVRPTCRRRRGEAQDAGGRGSGNGSGSGRGRGNGSGSGDALATGSGATSASEVSLRDRAMAGLHDRATACPAPRSTRSSSDAASADKKQKRRADHRSALGSGANDGLGGRQGMGSAQKEEREPGEAAIGRLSTRIEDLAHLGRQCARTRGLELEPRLDEVLGSLADAMLALIAHHHVIEPLLQISDGCALPARDIELVPVALEEDELGALVRLQGVEVEAPVIHLQVLLVHQAGELRLVAVKGVRLRGTRGHDARHRLRGRAGYGGKAAGREHHRRQRELHDSGLHGHCDLLARRFFGCAQPPHLATHMPAGIRWARGMRAAGTRPRSCSPLGRPGAEAGHGRGFRAGATDVGRSRSA